MIIGIFAASPQGKKEIKEKNEIGRRRLGAGES